MPLKEAREVPKKKHKDFNMTGMKLAEIGKVCRMVHAVSAIFWS